MKPGAVYWRRNTGRGSLEFDVCVIAVNRLCLPSVRHHSGGSSIEPPHSNAQRPFERWNKTKWGPGHSGFR
jgi:hypothetical protein